MSEHAWDVVVVGAGAAGLMAAIHAAERGARALLLDAVTLRRALVDEGFVDRDPAGRDYRASRRHERFVRFDEVPDARNTH